MSCCTDVLVFFTDRRKPGEVLESHRRRAVVVWTGSVVAIFAYSGWLCYKAAEKAKAPDTSFVLTNVVYKYPDLWICPYVNYGCDAWELEEECVDSAWMTEGGEPDAVFYPREKLDQLHQVTTEERKIAAIPDLTNFDSEGNFVEDGRGHCVIFETSAATDFVGQERDSHEYLDYIHLDMYWYPGGKFGNSTTCVAEGVEWADHREWVYGFLSDPEDSTAISTGFPLSYSCITNTSNTHIFNTLGIGLTNQNKFMEDDISSYKALFTNFGVHKNTVNPNVTMPYAHLSLEMKQQADSWEIITESNPYEFAEMFGNIGGFWDLLLILWPLCFVTATQQDPHLKPRTFKKSVIRGAERAAGVTKVIARAAPVRHSNAMPGVDGFEDQEEVPAWEGQPVQRQQPPQSATNWQEAHRC
ncbi:hypothetical protein Esi_0005_0128 [Ectocarpus siliculosus]|uniref:Uncharacterized protein n=1 Tax=Ectocarpus siliculosus TaxID=2880 RepID=D8LNQ3_ECTSI|nr:hypothetical protein Esi_0005_0128 [Ectocarpus siliculosus]|eukprot:CBN78263.1 hypothetical protein Esi_0005_0128 [Ectocarpus siliculosus]